MGVQRGVGREGGVRSVAERGGGGGRVWWDLICGEITPEGLSGPMEGYFSRGAFFRGSPTLHARFGVPDWRHRQSMAEPRRGDGTQRD